MVDCEHPEGDRVTLGSVEANEFGPGNPEVDIYVIRCQVCGSEWEAPKGGT